MKTYTVAVSREGKWWVGVVDGLIGAATEATRLADLDIEVRDLIAGLTDTDESEFGIAWDLTEVLGPDGQTQWAAFLAERDDLEARRRQFEADRLDALRALHRAGVSARDSATLAGLSHQRVAQLLGT